MARAPHSVEDKVIEHGTGRNTKIVNIPQQHKPWVFAVLAVIAVLLAFAIGTAAANHHSGFVYGGKNVVMGPAGGGFGTRVSGEHFRTGGMFGGTTNAQDRTQGVVTAVNGGNFTIAGQGSTTQVTTNSSTKYQNGNQVKQNDTVIVFGTNDNGTITATSIIINP